MRALLQRVSYAHVSVDNEVISTIGNGLLILVGIHKSDAAVDGGWIIRKVLSARIFEDESGKMGRSIVDIGGEILIVSQFTLYGEMRKGTRPDFSDSMAGSLAREFYNQWVADFRKACSLTLREGRFAATMKVQSVNEGPVTLMLDSRQPHQITTPATH